MYILDKLINIENDIIQNKSKEELLESVENIKNYVQEISLSNTQMALNYINELEKNLK